MPDTDKRLPDDPVQLVIPGRRRDLGGFDVARVLPSPLRRMVGPFVFFDHLGPLSVPRPVPRSMDVRPHPHIGLSTVTFLFDGELTHRDSLGVEQVIRPGEVNWMTAGGGITHSERFDGMRTGGGTIHGIQSWVALPEAKEERPPAFAHLAAHELPRIEEDGVDAILIAGDAYGESSPAACESPLFYVYARLAAGARLPQPRGHTERAAYLVSGDIAIESHPVRPGELALIGNADATITAVTPSIVMLLGGEPVGERHIWWNFVSSRRERIDAAKADWASGRFELPPNDAAEFIPLPREPQAPQPL